MGQMARARPVIRDFRCPVCGVKVSCTKRRGRKTPLGHVKTMWCYRCQKVRDFIQIE